MKTYRWSTWHLWVVRLACLSALTGCEVSDLELKAKNARLRGVNYPRSTNAPSSVIGQATPVATPVRINHSIH